MLITLSFPHTRQCELMCFSGLSACQEADKICMRISYPCWHSDHAVRIQLPKNWPCDLLQQTAVTVEIRLIMLGWVKLLWAQTNYAGISKKHIMTSKHRHKYTHTRCIKVSEKLIFHVPTRTRAVNWPVWKGKNSHSASVEHAFPM